MLRLRRSEPQISIELMPLIDVIFLILTFFVYAMVMMVRLERPRPVVATASSRAGHGTSCRAIGSIG